MKSFLRLRNFISTFCLVMIFSKTGFNCINRDVGKSSNRHTITEQVPVEDTTYKYYSSINRLLHLQRPLQVNDLQIKFWLDNSDSLRFVILEKRHETWSSSNYSIKIFYDEKFDVDTILTIKTIKDPKSGWQSYLEKIQNLGIYDLKSFEEISGYYNCADGDALTIEITNSTSSTYFVYPCYQLYDEKLREIIQLKDILKLTEVEFGYRLLPGE